MGTRAQLYIPNLTRCAYFLTHWGRDKIAIFTDDISKCIFLNENPWISRTISLKFVAKVRIDSAQAIVQIMAGCQPGDKPLSEPMMVSYWRMHTWPQWVNQCVICIAIHEQQDYGRAFWNPLGKLVPGKFHLSGGRSNHNYVQDRAKFDWSRTWQIVLIFMMHYGTNTFESISLSTCYLNVNKP